MKKTRSKHNTSTPSPQTSESMEALASGMADDFNNILTTVMGACSLIDKSDPNSSELRQCVDIIRTSAERAALLSEKLIDASSHEQDSKCNDCKMSVSKL